MDFASLTEELQGLTPLIAVLLSALGVWYFRAEIKHVVRRLTKIEASRKDTTVTATMSERDAEEAPDASGSPANGDKEPEESEEGKAVTASELGDDAQELRAQMISAYMGGDKAKGDELYDRLVTVETDSVELRRGEIVRRASGFIGGVDADGLNALEEKVNDPDLGYLVYRMIGACLAAGEKQAEAAEAYEKSIELGKTFDEKVTSASLRSAALSKMGVHDKALNELSAMLAEAPADRATRENLWSAIANAYKARGDTELYAGSLHQVALLAGNSAAKWFQAAYAYSEAEKSHLTILVIHCYKTCLSFNAEHQYARNNLGVVLRENDMPCLGADHYEDAAKLGNTLAMGNLGQIYLSAGFVSDAEKMLNRAGEHPNPDEKVAQVRANIASRRADEDKKLEGLTNAGSRAGQFVTRYVSARSGQTIPLSTGWTWGEIEVAAEASDDAFTAAWSEGNYRGGRRFLGTRSGAAITGVFEAEGSSLMSEQPSWKKDGSGYGIVSDDGEKIEFLKLTEDEATYLELSDAS